ncbi:MAG TPA: MFS transporter [Candidatus Saccharimonadales bacterium]|nr:MFS transporter [Candidatus Saccharimonadales bacterium]
MHAVKERLKKNDIAHVLLRPSFSFLMFSEFFSQIAFNMQHFVLIFLIYELTHSNTAVSGIILSFTIPAILFSLLAGVFVDRWNKKTVLFTTNFLRGVMLLPFLIPNAHPSIIYTLTFFIAIATQFFLPAESSIIPLLVPKQKLVAANAIFSIGIYSTVLIGYILAGPLLLVMGRSVFLLLSVLFFISAFLILGIRVPKREEKHSAVSIQAVELSIGREIREIFSYMRKVRNVMRALIILTMAQAIIFTFAVLGPGYLATILKTRVESLSWLLLAPAALGMVTGALILGSNARKLKHAPTITVGFIVTGLIFIFLPFISSVSSKDFILAINSILPSFLDVTGVHIIVFLAFIAGFSNALVFVPANATIQSQTPESIRGRIYGFLNAMTGSVSLLPVALAGGLADIFGVSQVITSIGIAMIILAVFEYIF